MRGPNAVPDEPDTSRPGARSARLAALFFLVLVVSCSTGAAPEAGRTSEVHIVSAVEPERVPPLGGSAPGLRDVLAVVAPYAEHHRDTYAGHVVAGGRVWVGFTSEADRHLAELQSQLPPQTIAAYRGRRTYAQLEDLHRRVSDDMSELRGLGLDVLKVGMDPLFGRVTVLIANTDAVDARAVLATRYPSDALAIAENGRVDKL